VQHFISTTNMAILLTCKSPSKTSLQCNPCYSAPANLRSSLT